MGSLKYWNSAFMGSLTQMHIHAHVLCMSESESFHNGRSVGRSVSQSVSQSVHPSWRRAPFGTHNQVLTCCQTRGRVCQLLVVQSLSVRVYIRTYIHTYRHTHARTEREREREEVGVFRKPGDESPTSLLLAVHCSCVLRLLS
jgi:hypothetical protein